MIELRDVSLTLGGRVVLDQVSLSLDRGEILGLIGPPEAGKSILLKTMAALTPAPAGEILAGGVPAFISSASARPWRQRIGMAFQNDALFDSLTVFENVAFPLRRRGVAGVELQARVTERLSQVGLVDAGAKLPSELSGGMRKRVGIARATVSDPELGLFDDPTAGLDPVTGGRILDLIVALTRSLGMATIVVSNDLPVLLPICSRVVMMHLGRVVYSGAPDGLRTSARPEVVQFANGADEGPL